MYPTNASTTQAFSNASVSFGDVTTNLLPTGNYTILNWLISGTSGNNVDLVCSSNSPDYFARITNAQVSYPQSRNDTIIRCWNGTIDLIQRQKVSATDINFAQVTYLNYIVDSTTVATNTPYTEQSTDSNGVHYSYDPLKAQAGIMLFGILFVLAVWAIVKLIKK